MSSNQVRWYLDRLKSMTPAEVAWRTRSAARIPLDWIHSRSCRSPGRRLVAPNPYPVHSHDCGGPMDRIRIFDLEFPVGYAFDWHWDYRHGIAAPRKFSPLLNIRNTDSIGDIKYVWECNRHQFLSALAYSANRNAAKGYIIFCIDSWISANPYLRGVNWTSSLELALRIISWALVFPAIESLLTRDTGLNRFAQSIHSHLYAISRNLSQYSSANNHLIGEAAGLYVGAVCFPWWTESVTWQRTAQAILENEILAQVTSDGVNKEQATSYHLFTLELLLLACLIGHNVGNEYGDDYLERLHAMLVYLHEIATPAGALPSFGDSDEGRGFLFSSHESNFRVVMDLGGRLFREPAWLQQFPESPTASSRALLTGAVERTSKARSRRHYGLFREAGIGVLEGGNGTKLIMDFGPLGYRTIAAHGHADALSMVLALGNEFFLIDPGTYAYHSHPEWRSYFRSTAAHNTARVDGLDQSVMGGPFLWTLKAESTLLSYQNTPEEGMIVAEHHGYERLSDPVTHRRSVRFDKRRSEITVRDSFLCRRKHHVEVFFHLHPESRVIETSMHGLQVEWQGRRIHFTTAGLDVQCEIFRGQQNPILGWCSTGFNEKQPTLTLRLSATIHGSTTVISNLKIE
jgi:hypothetical protein